MPKTIEPIDASFDDVVEITLTSPKHDITGPVKTKLIGWFVEIDGRKGFKTEDNQTYLLQTK